MTSAQLWSRRHHWPWADVIRADFQAVISRYLHNVNTRLFCTADKMFRTIIMQNSRLIYACFPIKIDKVWMDRFCVRYDWWRRLQPTSSVSPVWLQALVIPLISVEIYMSNGWCMTFTDVYTDTCTDWQMGRRRQWQYPFGLRGQGVTRLIIAPARQRQSKHSVILWRQISIRSQINNASLISARGRPPLVFCKVCRMVSPCNMA